MSLIYTVPPILPLNLSLSTVAYTVLLLAVSIPITSLAPLPENRCVRKDASSNNNIRERLQRLSKRCRCREPLASVLHVLQSGASSSIVSVSNTGTGVHEAVTQIFSYG